MRFMRPLLLAFAVCLVLPAGALAGGWATTGLSSTPDGVKPGGKWEVDLTILQHGRTPLEDVSPAVIIKTSEGGQARFDAVPVEGQPGVYRASVDVPADGRYEYAVDDGFGNAMGMNFTAVDPAAAPPAAAPAAIAEDSRSPWPWIVAGVVLLVLLAFGARRMRGGGLQPA